MHALAQMIEQRDLARTLIYSSYTLLAWDFLLTLDDEIRYIWESPCSVVKCLFIGNRYSNLLMLPVILVQTAGVLPLKSNAACLSLTFGLVLYHFWSLSSVHFLVMTRIWILNGRIRKFTIALVMVLILYVCAVIALIAYILGAITFNINSASSPGSCGGQLGPHSWLIWIVELASESISNLSGISQLVRNLYRHAVIFLLANTFGDALSIIAWTIFLRAPLYHIANSFPVALVSITGQRLAIDLRRLHVRKDITQSEVSREVEHQLAAFDRVEDLGVP